MKTAIIGAVLLAFAAPAAHAAGTGQDRQAKAANN